MFMNYDMQGCDGSIVQFTRITIWYNLFFKAQLKQPCSGLLSSADFQESIMVHSTRELVSCGASPEAQEEEGNRIERIWLAV
jgi:hypothetical protein